MMKLGLHGCALEVRQEIRQPEIRRFLKNAFIGSVLSVGWILFLSGCKRSNPVSKPVSIVEDKAPSSVETPKDEVDGASSNPNSEVEPSLPAVAGSDLAESETKQPQIPEGKWTQQRLIALTPKGPIVIDLMLRVGGVDMDAANAAAIQPIREDLLKQLGENLNWESVLELPLIKSGWLGNLLAEGDQATQLIGMYDKNKDMLVQADELTEFLTRGLSRSQPLTIADSGSEPNPDGKSSTFGPLDSDDDNVLSSEELKSGPNTLAKLDFNSDSNVSVNELSNTQTTAMMADNRMGRPMLKSTSLIFYQPALGSDEKSARKLLQRKAADLMEHYSFLGSIERSNWPGWNDQQWSSLDKNDDGAINKAELLSIFEIETAVRIAVDLPSPFQDNRHTAWYFHDGEENIKWSSESGSAQFHNRKIDLLVTIEDSLSNSLKSLLKSRLNEALKNSQLKQFLIQQLQLKENALELVDKDGDQSISDSESEAVWHWLVARQSARIQGRWLLSARPWFQLLDKDRNLSISEFEVNQLSVVLGPMDENQDDLVDLTELPLVVRLQLSRQDQRVDLRGFQLGETASGPADDSDWFSAMDTNRDGSIGKHEFLGANSEFRDLDRDGDGFISKAEVY